MVRGEQVQELLFSFMQHAFGGEVGQSPDTARLDEALVAMTAHRTLRAETVAGWPEQTRHAAREWLTALLMVVSLTPDMPFPANFLDGTTATRLGEPVLALIRQRSDELRLLGRSRDESPPA